MDWYKTALFIHSLLLHYAKHFSVLGSEKGKQTTVPLRHSSSRSRVRLAVPAVAPKERSQLENLRLKQTPVYSCQSAYN